ncbi:hypothetical protein C0J52_22217 [Blattella germanica]|nr:hypothetical protein C0J52_22217 [Blattella germanica]
MEERPMRIRPDPSLEHARQRAELLGLPPPPEPVRPQESAIPSSPPPSYEHVLAEAERTPEEETENTEESRKRAVAGPVVKRPEILHKSSKELYQSLLRLRVRPKRPRENGRRSWCRYTHVHLRSHAWNSMQHPVNLLPSPVRERIVQRPQILQSRPRIEGDYL